MADKTATKNLNQSVVTDEIGRTGLVQYGGRVDEEFLLALKGSQKAKTLQEMSDNDPVVGATLLGMRQMMLSARMTVQPAGTSSADAAAAEFLESCTADMSHTWEEFRTENFSRFVHGWSWFTVALKKRLGENPGETTNEKGEKIRLPSSQFDDGRIGWRKFAPRSQTTLDRWEFDPEGGVSGMWQSAPPDYTPVFLDIKQSLHFTVDATKGNPEGRALLRNAYTSWNKKRRMENIEAVGFARDLEGMPVLIGPEGLDLFSADDPDMVTLLALVKKLVTRVKRDEQMGVVLPYGWEFKLLSSGGSRSIDTNETINRYNRMIGLSMLVQFLLLGMDRVGSYELAREQKNVWLRALWGWMLEECAVINRYAIPTLFRLNAFPGISGYPTLVPDNITQPEITDLAEYLDKMVGKGVITPDAELEKHVRGRASLPEQTEPEEGENQAEKPEPEEGKEPDSEGKAGAKPKDESQNIDAKPTQKSAGPGQVAYSLHALLDGHEHKHGDE